MSWLDFKIIHEEPLSINEPCKRIEVIGKVNPNSIHKNHQFKTVEASIKYRIFHYFYSRGANSAEIKVIDDTVLALVYYYPEKWNGQN